MTISANVTILIIILCSAGCSLLGYVIYRMFWLDNNGKNKGTDSNTAGVADGMTPSDEQKKYMKVVRDRYRGDLDDVEAGLDKYEMPPKTKFQQSVETLDTYDSREDMYDYDLRTPKPRFGDDNTRSKPDDWL
jgi:hypothetical protein